MMPIAFECRLNITNMKFRAFFIKIFRGVFPIGRYLKGEAFFYAHSAMPCPLSPCSGGQRKLMMHIHEVFGSVWVISNSFAYTYPMLLRSTSDNSLKIRHVWTEYQGQLRIHEMICSVGVLSAIQVLSNKWSHGAKASIIISGQWKDLRHIDHAKSTIGHKRRRGVLVLRIEVYNEVWRRSIFPTLNNSLHETF